MKQLSLISTCLLIFLTAGCGGMFKSKEAADQSIASFHKRYDDGKFAEIYSTGHKKFKEAASEKEFLEFMAVVQRKLGKVTQSSAAGFNVRSLNLTTSVVVTQSTTFEQGKGSETFTFEMDSEKAVLVGYNISSKELIMK